MPSFRTYPVGASLEARGREEYLIWDQRQKDFWKFGLLQPQLAVAAHGMVEAAVSIFPISFFEITGASSLTNRLFDTKTFDCENEICRGNLIRNRFTTRLLAGSGDYLAVLSYHRIFTSISDDSKPFVDEVEVLTGNPGHDTFEDNSLLIGRKSGERTFGIYLKKGKYVESGSANEAQYLILRGPYENYQYVLGVGRYASDFTAPGLSVYANVLWKWGESLALY